MALVRVSNREKKLLIWTFMEELWENHQNAVKYKLDSDFRFMYFYNVGLLVQYLAENGVADKIVLDILKEYANETGYIKIKGNTVKLTRTGLDECQKPKHDW